MATQAEALLYEVYLHAEHEEVGETPAQVSRPPADPSAPQPFGDDGTFRNPTRPHRPFPVPIHTQAVASLLGDDSDDEDDELPLSKRAVKLAGKAAVGIYGAVRTSIKSAVARVGGGDDAMRPLLVASARGAEVAVATGGTVRTFRDEDDF